MLLLDSITNLTLSTDDVCALDSTRLSSPDAFRKFAKGIRMEQDFLLNDRWAQLPPMNSAADMLGVVMHQMLPVCYDAAWLEGLGGSFGVRVTGIGDYTFITMNRRVVTLSGLPVDASSGAETLDLEIAPEILQGFCRGLLLDIADDVLEEDEFEDRVLSGAELLLHGMPSGGYLANEADTRFGQRLISLHNYEFGTIAVGGKASGAIEVSMGGNMYAFMLNEGITYRLEMSGAGSGSGTMENPHLTQLFNAFGHQLKDKDKDGIEWTSGLNKQSRIIFTPKRSGTYFVLAGGAGASDIGSYRLTLSVGADTVPLLPSVEIGGDFQSSVDGARSGSIGAVSINGFAKGTVSYAKVLIFTQK
ncbi:MAG: hypothetical protein QM744_04785 [Mesorhizobium sp.]